MWAKIQPGYSEWFEETTGQKSQLEDGEIVYITEMGAKSSLVESDSVHANIPNKFLKNLAEPEDDQ